MSEDKRSNKISNEYGAEQIQVLEGFIQDNGIMATGALHRISRLMTSQPDFQIDSLAGSIKSSFAEVALLMISSMVPLPSE